MGVYPVEFSYTTNIIKGLIDSGLATDSHVYLWGRWTRRWSAIMTTKKSWDRYLICNGISSRQEELIEAINATWE